MKIKTEQLGRFAALLIKNYRDKDIFVGKAEDRILRNKIIEIIANNFAEEEAIEEEARKMLATHSQGARGLDPYKIFLLAKQKLAAKRGFVL